MQGGEELFTRQMAERAGLPPDFLEKGEESSYALSGGKVGVSSLLLQISL